MLVILLLSLFVLLNGELISLLDDPFMKKSRNFYLRHPTGNKSLYGPIGNLSTPEDWAISQWQIPEELKAEDMGTKECECSNPLYSTYNEYAKVCLCEDPKLSEGLFELEQLGENLNCGTFSTVEEFDLFVEQSQSDLFEKSPLLSQVNDLFFDFSVQMNEMSIIGYECGPPCSGEMNNVTYTSTISSIIFSTSSEYPHQTLYVQFILYDSRNGVCSGLLDPCSTTVSPQWFFTTNPTYGVNFGVGSVGKNSECISKLHQEYNYQLEIMDVLKKSVFGSEYAPEDLDKDLSHWKVSSFYVGNIMQGRIDCSFFVKGIDLSYSSS